MAAGIFISYRRDDSRHVAGRLAGDLADRFGAESIFRDVESIDGGEEFPVKLDRALEHCAMMLVLIGPAWLEVKDHEGRRRLDNPDDWVRLEIATALKRKIRVVPVMVEDTQRPDESSLPDDLKSLAIRQARMLSDLRWRGDLQALVDMLAKVPGLKLIDGPAPAPPPPAPNPSPDSNGRKTLLKGVGLGVLGLLVAAYMFTDEDELADLVPPAFDAVPATAAPVSPQGSLPNITGLWRTASGETYRFEQDGRDVFITAMVGAQTVGEGQGNFDGHLLRIALSMTVNGQFMGTSNCNLQTGPGGQSFTGMCQGPNGNFPAQLFR